MNRTCLIISCEHGGNKVPEPYTLPFHGQAVALASHRGGDLGALPVAKEMAKALLAPLLFTTITRLLIDTNRSLNNRALFSSFSRTLSPQQREAVIAHHYRPHRERVKTIIGTTIEQGEQVLHLAIHSFTPVLDGVTRPTDIGLLYDSRREREQSFCRDWQHSLAAARPDLRIHRNAPYRGASDGVATWLRKQHPQTDYLGIEVEINQKRLTTTPDQTVISTLLAQTLRSCLDAPPPPLRADPRDEIVVIVDENNQVTGQLPRRAMRRHQLPHRATYILVTNRQGQIFVQKRTTTKDIYPGYYDIAAGGVVLAGETYEVSARRELQEELGVSGELEYLFDTYFADEGNKVWGRVFRCRHEGPFVLQAAEVESGEFMAPDAIIAATGATFTPDGLAILAALKKGALPA